MAYRITFVLLFAAIMLASLAAHPQITAKNWGENTAGVQLILHEGPRQNSAQGTILWYNLIGQGFPSGVPYTLWRWQSGQEPKAVIEGVSFGDRGVLVCSGQPGFCKGQGLDDPINIKTTAAPGEMKRFAVASRDGKIAGFADAVPIPR